MKHDTDIERQKAQIKISLQFPARDRTPQPRAEGHAVKGSVTPVPGRPRVWKLVFDAPILPGEKRTFRQKRETVYGMSRREAEKHLQQRIAESQNGIHQAPQQPAREPETALGFIPYLRQWLEVRSARLARRTYERYDSLITQIAANLDGGDISLAEVTPQVLERLLQRLLKRGGVHGGPLSPTTVLQAYATIRAALRKAHRQQLIARNPCETIEPPRARRVDVPVLERRDVVRLLDALRGSAFYVPSILAAFGGLRRGELLALTWRDVDLATGILTIHQAVEESRRGLSLTTPKSGRPRRVALPAIAVEALKEHERSQAILREKRDDWNVDGIIVPSTITGKLQTPSTFSKYLKQALEAASFPDVTLHVLRHAHISLLGSLGVHPRTMQAQAGHSSSSFTLDRYQHLMSGAQVEAAALLDGAMREAGFQASTPDADDRSHVEQPPADKERTQPRKVRRTA